MFILTSQIVDTLYGFHDPKIMTVNSLMYILYIFHINTNIHTHLLDFFCLGFGFFFIIFFYFNFFISWRLITLQYCSGFCHTLKWISHGFTCVSHPISLPTSSSTRSLWVFPVHQAWALVSCILPGLVICFTLGNIHVSVLFSWNIPLSPSPTESKSLFYTSVSLFLFCI